MRSFGDLSNISFGIIDLLVRRSNLFVLAAEAYSVCRNLLNNEDLSTEIILVTH